MPQLKRGWGKVSKKEQHIVRLRSVDGMLFHLKFASISEYFFTGVFLRFIGIFLALVSMVLFVVLMIFEYPDGDIGLSLVGAVTSLAMFMFYVVAAVMFWLVFVGEILFRLFKRRILKTIYTPFLYLPFVPVFLIFISYNGVSPFTESAVIQLLFFIFIFAILDVAHAHFVAPLHSKFVGNPDDKPAANLNFDTVEKGAEPHLKIGQPLLKSEVSKLPANLKSQQPEQSTKEEFNPNLDESVDPLNAIIEIGDEGFIRKDIRWIESQDHYLKVQVKSKSVMVRANLSDVVSQLHLSDGVQVNRSLWVSHVEIKDLQEVKSGRLELKLQNGETVIVPNTRSRLVRQNYGLYRKSIEGFSTDQET